MQLFNAVKRGLSEGWEEMQIEQLYTMYMNDLYRYLYSLCRNHSTTEDLLQDTFYKAHITLLTNNITDIKPWLFKVAYYTYIDFSRKEKRTILADTIDQININSPETIVTERDSLEVLLRFLDQIKPIEQQAILLCDVHDCTIAQAATILNVKINTLKSHLTRGRKKVRALLQKEGY